MACNDLVSHTTKDWTRGSLALALEKFSKDMHFSKFSDKLCMFLTVYKSCFYSICLFRCKRVLASLSDPFVGVIFRYRVESDLARHVTSFWTAGMDLYNVEKSCFRC